MAEKVSERSLLHSSDTNRATIMGMALDLLTPAQLVERVFRDL